MNRRTDGANRSRPDTVDRRAAKEPPPEEPRTVDPEVVSGAGTGPNRHAAIDNLLGSEPTESKPSVRSRLLKMIVENERRRHGEIPRRSIQG